VTALDEAVRFIGAAGWIAEKKEGVSAAPGEGVGPLRFRLTDRHDLRPRLFEGADLITQLLPTP
jgi:hypothetical protein